MLHQKTKLCMAIVGALALGASAVANAQSSDSNARGNSPFGGPLWGWDDPSASRPQSWIPGTSYGYVGVGVGRSDYDLRCTQGFSCDDTDTAYKIFTGGKFSRLLGIEAGYVYLGKAEANGGETKAQGINVSLIGNVPIGDIFNVYAKVGGIFGWTDTGASIPGAATGDRHGLNVSYGAGVQFDVTRNWAIQGDWDHYRFDFADHNDDVQLYSLNLVYKY
jgi:OOP family OmpA-OmpF porin